MSFQKITRPAKRAVFVAENLKTNAEYNQKFLSNLSGDSEMGSLIDSYISKNQMTKAEMYEEIKTLAVAKLNTISDHITKALVDDIISVEEYYLILSDIKEIWGNKITTIAESLRNQVISQEVLAIYV